MTAGHRFSGESLALEVVQFERLGQLQVHAMGRRAGDAGPSQALVWNISSFRPNGYALLYFLWSKPFTGSCPGGLHLHIELQWLRSDSLMATVGWFNGYWFTIFDIPRIVKLDGCMQRVTDNQPFSWSSPRTIGAPCRHSPTPTVYLQKNILNRSF